MSISTEKYTIKDTADNFSASNPVLPLGIIGIETDTGLVKIGDGVTAWLDIAYANINGSTINDTIPAGLEKYKNAAGLYDFGGYAIDGTIDEIGLVVYIAGVKNHIAIIAPS